MLSNVVDILELFSETRPELGVAEVAKIVGRPKSTVSGWMAAMQEVGFLDRDDNGGPYRLGIRLATYGQLAQRATSVQRAASPLLQQLTRRTKETASLNELIGAEVVNTVVVESPLPIHSAGGLGIPMPVHATAAGKVLIAWRSAEDVRHLLPLRLEQFTEETITDVTVLTEQLSEIREKGYSVAEGELARDLVAISAPVRDNTGRVIAALSIAGPTSRFATPRIEAVAQDLVETAQAVSLSLGYRPEKWQGPVPERTAVAAE